MLYAIFMIDKPGAAVLRDETAAAHRAYMAANTGGMRLGGPLLDTDGTSMIGSMVVGEFADWAAAEAFVAQEPYNRAGLFESVIIRPFKAVVDTAAGHD